MRIWMIVLIAQVSQLSCEVFLLKVSEDENVTLTCVATDDGNALIWNSDLKTDSPNEFSNKSGLNIGHDVDCGMDDEEAPCYHNWQIKGWSVSNSTDNPIGPVYDKRWEGFKEMAILNPHGNASFVLMKDNLQSRDAIAFSIRTSFNFQLNFHQMADNEKERTRCMISFYENSLKVGRCTDEATNDWNDTSNVPSSVQKPGILSSLEWKTFMLTWDSKRNRLSIFNENNKLLSVENINSLPKTNDEWRLTLSHERGSYRIRVHDYRFLHTSEQDSILKSPAFFVENTPLCVEMWVALCVGCRLEITHEHGFLANVNAEGTIHGYPIWQRVKINVPKNDSNDETRINFKTTLERNNSNMFWAISNVQRCASEGLSRRAGLLLPITTDLEKISCQEMMKDRTESVRATMPFNRSLKLNQDNCSEENFGPGCIINCKEQVRGSCRNVIVCQKQGCTCAPGFEGENCDERNETGASGDTRGGKYERVGECETFVENFEITEVNQEGNNYTMHSRWKLPHGLREEDVETYTLKFCTSSGEEGSNFLIKPAINVTSCIWAGFICGIVHISKQSGDTLALAAKIKHPTKETNSSPECINVTSTVGKLSEPPVNVNISRLREGITSFQWELPSRTNTRITEFIIKANYNATDLTKIDISNVDIDERVFSGLSSYQLRYNTTLKLLPSTTYDIEIYAKHNNTGGQKYKSRINTLSSVGFGGPLLHTINTRDFTVSVTIPKIVNNTVNNQIQVILMSSYPCAQHYNLTEKILAQLGDIKFHHVWVNDSYLTAEYEGERVLIIGKDKKSDCFLKLGYDYELFLIVADSNSSGAGIQYLKKQIKIVFKERASPRSSTGILLLIVSPIGCIVLGIIAMFMKSWSRRIKKVKTQGQEADELDQLLYKGRLAHERTDHLYLETSVSERTKVGGDKRGSLTEINIKDFETYVENAISSHLLDHQYNTYVKGQMKPADHGMLSYHKSKNRYFDLIAYDDTRVVLQTLYDDPHSDYINANYVKGLREDVVYIATQGPKDNTVDDFWRMIWQEDVKIICMLANVIEGGKKKCEKYWPDFEQRMMYGEIFVKNIKNIICPDYTIRTLEMSCDEGSRKVQHLHFTAWPDHGVPKGTHSIVSYLRKLVSMQSDYGPSDKSPIVVHCSAGVGRTGSIIVAHSCLLRAAYQGVIDVYSETARIREQRPNMVDNERQYFFVHLVLVEYLHALATALPCNEHLSTLLIKSKAVATVQEERLKSRAWLDKVLNPSPCLSTISESQLAKNRCPNLAYGAITRVFLQKYPTTDSGSNYISAVFVPGMQSPKQFIASQFPLPTTRKDFWRMIAEFEVELVIVLQRPDPCDPSSCELVPQLETYQPTPYLIITPSESEYKNPYRVEKLTLTDRSKEPKRDQFLTIISYDDWKPWEEQPRVDDLVSLFKYATSIKKSDAPAVVLCYDGVRACGLYLGMNYLLERMIIEEQCDVCLAVRTVRQARSDFVKSTEQFVFLYDAAIHYSGLYIPRSKSLEKN